MYGVGSKRDFLNIYLHEHIRNRQLSTLVVNGYISGTNMKSIFRELYLYLQKSEVAVKRPISLQDQYD